MDYKEKIERIFAENQHELGFGNRGITSDRFDVMIEEIINLFPKPLVNTDDEKLTPCPSCYGEGHITTSHEFVHCKMCDGTGKITVYRYNQIINGLRK